MFCVPMSTYVLVSKRIDALSVRSMRGLDRGTESGEHRGAAGAERELEQVIPGHRAMPIEPDILCFQDREHEGEWRVVDDDGGGRLEAGTASTLTSSERKGRKRRRQIVKGEGVRRRRGAAILSVSTPTVCSVRGRPRQRARVVSGHARRQGSNSRYSQESLRRKREGHLDGSPYSVMMKQSLAANAGGRNRSYRHA
jgi:hypothetical protein